MLVVAALAIYAFLQRGQAIQERDKANRARQQADDARVELATAAVDAATLIAEEDPRQASALLVQALDVEETERQARFGLAAALAELPGWTRTIGHAPFGKGIAANDQTVAVVSRGLVRGWHLPTGNMWESPAKPGQAMGETILLATGDTILWSVCPETQERAAGIRLVAPLCSYEQHSFSNSGIPRVAQSLRDISAESLQFNDRTDLSAIDPSGTRLAVATVGGIVLFDPLPRVLKGSDMRADVQDISFFADGRYLSAQTYDRTKKELKLFVWSTASVDHDNAPCTVPGVVNLGTFGESLVVVRLPSDEEFLVEGMCNPKELLLGSSFFPSTEDRSFSNRHVDAFWRLGLGQRSLGLRSRKEGNPQIEWQQPPTLTSVAVPPSGEWMATVESESAVRLVYPGKRSSRVYQSTSAAPPWLSFRPDGVVLAVGIDLSLHIPDGKRQQLHGELSGVYVEDKFVGVSSKKVLLIDGNVVADAPPTLGVARCKGSVVIVTETRIEIADLNGARRPQGSRSVKLDLEGRGPSQVTVSASADCSTVFIVAREKGEVLSSRGSQILTDVENGAVDPSGNWVVVATHSGVQRIDVDTAKPRWEPHRHRVTVGAIAIDPLGRFIVSGDVGGWVTFLDPDGGNVLGLLRLPVVISAIAVDPKGERLAVAGEEGTVILIDLLALTESKEDLKRRVQCATGAEVVEGRLRDIVGLPLEPAVKSACSAYVDTSL